MIPIADAFDHDYRGCDILFGRGRAADLGAYLGDHGLDAALVVCGSNVGANDDLMDPIREGLGDRHAGTFAETTPSKRIETAAAVVDEVDRLDADVVIGVGGGSSLDVARQATILAADGRDVADLKAEAEGGSIAPLEGDPTVPVIVVPTTFAGADVSLGGSLEVLPAADSPTGQPITARGEVLPMADLADPELVATTPRSVLVGSAMNGFNKGLETPYARDASPVSDASAIHGLRLFRDALPRVADGNYGMDAGDENGDDDAPRWLDRAVAGTLLVQFDRKISVIHAFGHGFSRRYDVHQGAIHAILAPHVLAYLFGEVDASRDALAAGLGVNVDGLDADAVADAVVEAVAEVRDGMGLPRRLRDLDATREADLPAIAEFIADDPPMERAPAGLTGDPDDIEAVLRNAW
ncbi:iron-containing alcohol dehydrogenase [Halorubrum sp. JWXQ-INN 858]|uniref:iron-containing alcohol dehydrogenase family protein n=1 Tax=Halorubrum sp. JWXQ-INN 858 TaxID=2690782 RepID=UPI00135A0B98|nr:iron-containing alcohol dehydrogenase family protein [Halorubrum sp. JWXQ-INN 858]MWV65191.1 iron-containing alcohol dehydrogenase [Halorubrum sp. JWXQ-INN 858]